jgi:hypothetical protein
MLWITTTTTTNHIHNHHNHHWHLQPGCTTTTTTITKTVDNNDNKYQRGLEMHLRLEPLVCILFFIILLTFIYRYATLRDRKKRAQTTANHRLG